MLGALRSKFSKTTLVLLALAVLVAAGNLTGTALFSDSQNQVRTRSSQNAPNIAVDEDMSVAEKSMEAEGVPGLVMDGLDSVATLPALSNRIIKAGSISLKVKKGRFFQTFDKVIAAAQTYGGHVSASNSSSGSGEAVSGTISIRIPSKNFEKALSKLRRLGEVTAIDINALDVSTEFVDLKSRLRHWRAQERVLLGLMEKANTITESITIHQQLSQIQLEIEQISGRLEYLKDQTSFSTLSVSIHEPGATVAPVDPWGLQETVTIAIMAFTNTLRGLIVLLGYLGPFALLFGLWFGIKAALKRGAGEAS